MMSKGLAPETYPARIFSNRSPNGKVCTSTVPPVLAPHSFQWFSIGLAICGPVWVATTRLTPSHLTSPIPFGNRLVGSAWNSFTSPAAGGSVASGGSVSAGGGGGASVGAGVGAPHPTIKVITISTAKVLEILFANLLFMLSLPRNLSDLIKRV